MAKRVGVNLTDKDELLFNQERKGFAGSDSAFFVQLMIDRANQKALGAIAEVMDEEDLSKFRYLIEHNDLSPVELLKKLIRREFWNHTDGKSQRQLVEDISVDVKKILYILEDNHAISESDHA